MDKFDKITRIKFSIFILYYFSFFVPIYSQTILGSTFKVSISELGAGTFFVVFFLILIIATCVVRFLNEKYYKYSYLATVGLMVLFLLILIFFKDNLSTLRIAWYVQFIFIGFLVLAHFKEDVTLILFDKFLHFVKESIKRMSSFVKKLVAKNKNRKNGINKEGNVANKGDLT